MPHPLKALFLVSILVLSGSILPFVSAQNSISIPSPLKQIRFGVPLYQVACPDGFQLMTKQGTSFPACVKLSSILRLTEWGWSMVGESAKIVGTLDYEERRQGGPVLFCDIYSITLNGTEKENLKTNSDKLFVYTNVIVNPDDSLNVMYPGNKLSHELKGKTLQITGMIVNNHGTLWCPNWHIDNNGTFQNIIPDHLPVIVPSKIEILN